MGKGRKFLSVTLGAILFTVVHSTPSMAEFQYPLKAISPVTTPFGEQRMRIGADYNKGERLLFQTIDKDRQVYRLPSFHFSMGVSSNVELLFSYPLIVLNQNDREQNYGSGDLQIISVLNLIRGGKIFPDCALIIATKLPNASDQEEFGTDETDFSIGGALSRHFGNLKLLVNADFAILGDPNIVNTQDDVFEYKVGFTYPVSDKLSAGLEIDGVEFSRRTNDRRFVRGGIALNWKRLLIDMGGALGLTEESGDFQAGVGITFKFGTAREPMNCPQ